MSEHVTTVYGESYSIERGMSLNGTWYTVVRGNGCSVEFNYRSANERDDRYAELRQRVMLGECRPQKKRIRAWR